MIADPFAPPAVHTAGVVVVNTTASPDDAVAATVSGDSARVAAGRVANVIVWSARTTVKLCATGGAAA